MSTPPTFTFGQLPSPGSGFVFTSPSPAPATTTFPPATLAGHTPSLSIAGAPTVQNKEGEKDKEEGQEKGKEKEKEGEDFAVLRGGKEEKEKKETQGVGEPSTALDAAVEPLLTELCELRAKCERHIKQMHEQTDSLLGDLRAAIERTVDLSEGVKQARVVEKDKLKSLKTDLLKTQEKWEESKNRVELMSGAIVSLNVGGTKFATSQVTLMSQPGSFFETLVSTRWQPSTQSEELFIDRDPKVFGHVLNFMRGQPLKLHHFDAREIDLLLDEAEYYNLPALTELLKDHLAQPPFKTVLPNFDPFSFAPQSAVPPAPPAPSAHAVPAFGGSAFASSAVANFNHPTFGGVGAGSAFGGFAGTDPTAFGFGTSSSLAMGGLGGTSWSNKRK